MVVHEVSVEEFIDVEDFYSAEVIRVALPSQLPGALAQRKPVVIDNDKMARQFLRLQHWQEARKWVFGAIVTALLGYAISRDYKIEASWHRDWKVNTLDGKVTLTPVQRK
jgi:hypothetical protein